MIISCMFMCAHIAFVYVMTMYSAVRIPFVANCSV